jgi:uncharacterized protein YaaR (DUF327 family)
MTALEAIIKEIDEKVAQLRDHLATGSVDTLEEYKRLCGEIRGLLFVREYTISLQHKLETSDD